MNVRELYRPHVRFIRQLKRRAREMRSGQHDETNVMAMVMAAGHIAFLVQQLAIAMQKSELLLAQRDAERTKDAA